MTLSRNFGLSRRQAYRYLKEAKLDGPPSAPAEVSITITLNHHDHTQDACEFAPDLRVHAMHSGIARI